MAWTTPKTDWAVGELVTAEDMKTLGENLAALKDPPTVVGTTAADIAAHFTEFADVDSANLTLTLTTTGGDVLIHLHASGKRTREFYNSGVNVWFDVQFDDNRQGGVDGIIYFRPDHLGHSLSFTYLVRNVSAGAHIFKLQWKNDAETTLNAGAQFWVREI